MPMNNATALLFFFISIYGLGYTATRFINQNSWETVLFRLAVGLALFPITALFLNIFRIPLDWRMFLGLSLLAPLSDKFFFKKKALSYDFKINLRQHSTNAAILFIVTASCLMYCRGPFRYPWLEDDDSWLHAASIKYIAIEKTLHVESGLFQYLNPYPPGYDCILGIIHQIHPSIYWTLKLFNGLFIVFGILWFCLLVRELTQSRTKALLAGIFLTMIPCYLSHFIWAHSLVVALFFPALYALIKTRKDKHFIIPAIFLTAGIFLTQPTQSVKFVILILLMASAYTLTEKKFWKTPLTVIGSAGLLSLIWWGPVFSGILSGSQKFKIRTAMVDLGSSAKAGGFLTKIFDPAAGTATRVYSFHDFWSIPKFNMINNPLGIGPVLMVLTGIGVLFMISHIITRADKIKRTYAFVTLFWLGFTFLGVNSKTFQLPIGLVAFRFWSLLAIPVSLLAAESIHHLAGLYKNRFVRNLSVALLLATVALSSGYPKFKLNTSIWPWGEGWGSLHEVMGYVWMRKNLEPDSKVFAFSENYFVIGNDMRADFWSQEYRAAFKDAFQLNLGTLADRLKKNQFQYIVIGQREIREYGLEKVNKKVRAMNKHPLFYPIYQQGPGMKIYEIL